MSSLGIESKEETQRICADRVPGHCLDHFNSLTLPPEPPYVKEQCAEFWDLAQSLKRFPRKNQDKSLNLINSYFL